MRIAVHFAAGHELARGDGPGLEPSDAPAIAAYKLGRIEDGVHNAPVGHPAVPLDDFLKGLLAEAQAEYPEHKISQDPKVANRISIERLVQSADDPEQGEWIPADTFDPEVHVPVGAGVTIEREVTAGASPAAGTED